MVVIYTRSIEQIVFFFSLFFSLFCVYPHRFRFVYDAPDFPRNVSFVFGLFFCFPYPVWDHSGFGCVLFWFIYIFCSLFLFSCLFLFSIFSHRFYFSVFCIYWIASHSTKLMHVYCYCRCFNAWLGSAKSIQRFFIWDFVCVWIWFYSCWCKRILSNFEFSNAMLGVLDSYGI